MSYSIRKIDSESQLASIQSHLNLQFLSKFLYRLIPSIDARWNLKKKQKLVDAETNTSEYTILCAYPFAQLSSTYRYKF